MAFETIEVRLMASWILMQIQKLIAAVLFPRSQELWRIPGRERPKKATPPFRQSGAFRKDARKY